MDRDLLQRYAEGIIASTGCLSGEIQTRLTLGQYDEALRAAGEFQDIFGKDNFFLELMDHGIAAERATRDDLLRIAKTLGLPALVTNDTHYNHPEDADRPGRAHLRRLRQAALRPQPAQVRRRRLLHQVGGRDARAVGRLPRGLRQHPRDRRAVRGRVRRVHRRLHGPRRHPGGRDRGELVPHGGVARHRGPLPRRAADPGGQGPRRDGARDHLAEGLLRLLPRGRRLHPVVQGQRHPRRPRPWLGCRLDRGVRPAHHRPLPPRARPVLRALPQPRAPLDARLRHRLRRPPPRRGDHLRHREVRRRPGRADRDLRPAQVQGRDQGRRPGARPRLRDLRPHHQGAAARRDGQGRPAQARSSTATTSATPRAASSARCTTPRSTSAPSSRPRSASRARSATGACTPPA